MLRIHFAHILCVEPDIVYRKAALLDAMADDCSGNELKAQGVDEDQPVDTEGLSTSASAKTWSDQSSDSGLRRHKPQLRTIWLQEDSSCIDFEYGSKYLLDINYRRTDEF